VPDEQHHDGANRRSDKTRTLIEPVPANRLADEGGQESADDAEDRRQDESLRLLGPGARKRVISPATKPITIIQRMFMASSVDWDNQCHSAMAVPQRDQTVLHNFNGLDHARAALG
jgi:hypothetical protein